MDSTQEFTHRHELIEEYYLDAFSQQRVKRTLINMGETIAIEDYPTMSKKGHLYAIREMIREAEYPSSECGECRYKVGNYTGDLGYLIYMVFKTRLLLKFFKFKLRFFQIFKIPFRYKYKTKK